MNKNDFLNEMLEEVKNLKDIAKEELPLVAKEYISAGRLSAWITFGIGFIILLIALGTGSYAILSPDDGHRNDMVFACGMISLISSVLSLVILGVGIGSLIDFYIQPRRMAIKAITSLRGGE